MGKQDALAVDAGFVRNLQVDAAEQHAYSGAPPGAEPAALRQPSEGSAHIVRIVVSHQKDHLLVGVLTER